MAGDGSDARRLIVTTGEMAYGPHAVARSDGKVLFVRGAAPDEEVEVAVREERPRYAYADVLAVRRASPARRAAPCPYLPRCGGCPWQHLDYDAQLRAKQRLVAEHLRRLGGLDVAVAMPLPSPRQLGYRRRIKLRVADGLIGFHAAASHDLVAIDHCLLAEPPVDAAIAALGDLVRRLGSAVRRLEVAAGGTGGRVVVAGEVEGTWIDADDTPCREWLAAHAATIAGLWLRGRAWRRGWGDVSVEAPAGAGPPLRLQVPSFTQVNDDANRLLIDCVVRWAAPRPGLRVLDLYAGAGNLSLPLRRGGAEVTAVEQDRDAAAAARVTAAAEPGAPLRVLAMAAEVAVRRLVESGERFDVVVLDPPRSGAAACLSWLPALQATRLVYVSCDPTTLARDLRALGAAYRVDAVQPIDFFPQTYHVETVVAATRACDPDTSGVAFAPRLSMADATRRPRRRSRTT